MKSSIFDYRWYLNHALCCYLVLNLLSNDSEITLATRTSASLDGQYSTVGKYSDAMPQLQEAINNDKNYASAECAKVVETNPEAKKASHVINDMNDEYMLNPCKAKIWFVIELCESIQATHMKIANYELFSSTPKDFTVFFSDVYPAIDWKVIGRFTATDSRSLQRFDLDQVGFGKFVRVELHSHYGNEHFCPISEVKVYGKSMVEEYQEKEKSVIESDNYVELNLTKTAIPKLVRRSSAYRVYRTLMVEPSTCGLIRSLDKTDTGLKFFGPRKKLAQNAPLIQPTLKPVQNRSRDMPNSIFVDLSNKVKALETSIKTQMEAIERKTEAKFVKLNREFRSLALIVIAYYVYKVMLDLM